MPTRHMNFGLAGEEYAAKYLRDRGYQIRQRNWRWRQWELDIICESGEDIIFVEVKTRAGNSVLPGIQAVTSSKQRKLVKVASHYLSAMNLWHRSCRFDLIVIVNDGDSGMKAEHIKNAFDLSDSMGGGDSPWQPW